MALDHADHLRASGVLKRFAIHAQNVEIDVLERAELTVRAGECVALAGPSGAGKSTLMRMIYGNYRAAAGEILVRRVEAGAPPRMVDVARADPHEVIALRRDSLGYVSQFLRVIPRVATLDIVAEPLLALGVAEAAARDRAASLLRRLNVPERLWPLSPLTFSGGEQQRVNIARGFAHAYPTMLLDEPTASLDAGNRAVVLELVEEAKAAGAAIIGIFHDLDARRRLSDREIDVGAFTPQAAA